MVNRKTVVLNVGGDLTEVPLSSDGHAGYCWLIKPLSKFYPTEVFNVVSITARYVWIFDGDHRRRIDREWLAQSDWAVAVKESFVIRFYGKAARNGHCCHRCGRKALPDDMIGYSEIVGPDSHRRVWEICPDSPTVRLWPIEDNIVELRRRGGPASERHIRMTAMDLWLICCGFVDGYEAVYACE